MVNFTRNGYFKVFGFSKRKNVGISLFISLFTLFTLQIQAQDKKELNVLFMISDDLTATALSSYENGASHTPNIDQLASEGTRFTKAYCQYPVCGPSRASMMFGYYPNATTTYGYISGRENVGPNRQSWAQLFKDNGYYTARVGKIFHMGSVDIMKGRNGEDDPASWTERFNSPAPEVHAKGDRELVQNNPYGLLTVSKDPNWNGGNQINIVKTVENEIHTDAETANKVSELLRQHKNEPFFIAAGFFRPHVPFVAPKSSFDGYPHEQVVMPPKVANDWHDIPEQGINYVNSVNGEMSVEQEKKAVAAYYASTSFLDDQVGKVLQTLKEEGLEKNTIVIFTSDHGFFLGEHRFWMKVGLMEESARVPLIIKIPGQAPAVCHSFAELIDLYPTISELAGLQPPNALQGKSLALLIENPKHEVRDFAFSVSQRNGRMGFLIRSSDWAYIQYGEKAEGGMELYDMKYDAGQYNNLALHPNYTDVVSEMQDLLKEKLVEVRTNDLGIDY